MKKILSSEFALPFYSKENFEKFVIQNSLRRTLLRFPSEIAIMQSSLKNTPQLAVGMKAKEKPLNDFVNVENFQFSITQKML